MMVWFLSPTGDFVTSLAARAKPALAGWAFPVAGLTFFWLVRLLLMLRRLRRGDALRPSESKPASETEEIAQHEMHIFRYWLIEEPGRSDVYVYGCQKDLQEYCKAGDRKFSLLSDERICEIGEEWLYDRLSSRLIRRDDGSLGLGSPWDAVVASSKVQPQSS